MERLKLFETYVFEIVQKIVNSGLGFRFCKSWMEVSCSHLLLLLGEFNKYQRTCDFWAACHYVRTSKDPWMFYTLTKIGPTFLS